MKQSKRPVPAAPVVASKEAEPAAEAKSGHIVERPDGFYWRAGEAEEYGPFPTLAEAEDHMESGGEPASDPEALHEAESELGISEWIDPDSGIPAEDSVPRIED